MISKYDTAVSKDVLEIFNVKRDVCVMNVVIYVPLMRRVNGEGAFFKMCSFWTKMLHLHEYSTHIATIPHASIHLNGTTIH